MEPAGHKHVYRGYGILVQDRASFQRGLAGRGIASRRYYNPPLHLQPAYAGSTDHPLPVAERVGEQQVYLPIFPAMEREEVGAVIEASVELLGDHALAGRAGRVRHDTNPRQSREVNAIASNRHP